MVESHNVSLSRLVFHTMCIMIRVLGERAELKQNILLTDIYHTTIAQAHIHTCAILHPTLTHKLIRK